MTDRIICPDTSMLIKYLSPDEHDMTATRLVGDAIRHEVPFVAPPWLWAEVGSVLCKKVRLGVLSTEVARQLWQDFQGLVIEYVDTPQIRQRAWELAEQFNLPTLYDAAFLACTELASAAEGATREFWTADKVLIRQLGEDRPSYVRELEELER